MKWKLDEDQNNCRFFYKYNMAYFEIIGVELKGKQSTKTVGRGYHN